MTWYKHGNSVPTNGLPHRIRLSDGTTRTKLHQYDLDTLVGFGLTTIPNPPDIDDDSEEVNWDGSKWVVSVTTDPVKLKAAWDKNIDNRKLLAENLLKKGKAYVENGGTLSSYFDKAIEILDKIGEDTSKNPFVYNWSDPAEVGYTLELDIEMSEYTLVSTTFAEFQLVLHPLI